MFSIASSGQDSPNYRLKVTAGPEYDTSTHQVVPVNSNKTIRFENQHATVNLCVRIQDYTGLPNNSPKTSTYFSHPLHERDQYSICFSFIPKHDVNADDLVFGNDFDRPIRDSLPPGFGTALSIVRWTLDPALDGDPYADKPYLYSPGVATFNYFRIGDKVDPGDIDKTLDLHSRVVEEGADGTGMAIRSDLKIPSDAAGRKKYFLNEDARKQFTFEKGRIYYVDFGNPYLGFNDFTLRLPGFHLHVAKYIDARKHKLRYTLKNRRTNETYAVVLLALLLHGSEQEVSERSEHSNIEESDQRGTETEGEGNEKSTK
ncbi:hypothetical protein VTN49DRAFT_6377 [Thermomyces lanuginosus]|uniref:uncharacterized protein n=1 Tax=Thermomyces lanuginosus TaxID=5541 RepID=UPI003742E048